MDWLAQYWGIVLGAILLGAFVLVEVVLSMRRRRPAHTGERRIRVVGVGGAGGNAVDEMARGRIGAVDYVAINTDAQVLEESWADRRVRIGDQLTQGLGAGGDPAIGRQAAEEDRDALRASLEGADLVFVTAGLGGGTGSGGAPVVAALAKEIGALAIGVATMPFTFEGAKRRAIAEAAASELRAAVDTLLLIENDRVLNVIADDTPLADAFKVVNDVLSETVRAIVDIMAKPGLVNLDFADIRAVMHDGGAGLTGIGRASGTDRSVEAATAAIANPLLGRDVAGAQAILLHVSGSSQLSLREVVRAADTVRQAADPEANVIFGATFDDHLRQELRVAVIATQFRGDGQAAKDRRVGSQRNATRRPDHRDAASAKRLPHDGSVAAPSPTA